MVKISVIVPVYNVEGYLNECLDSLLNQTFKDFEVICVNDGSTDKSLDILNDYAQRYSNFHVFSKENGGLGSARNCGLKHAQGDYIIFLDSDDLLYDYSLETLYDNALKNKSDFVFFKYANIDDEGHIKNKYPNYPIEKIFPDEDFDNFTFTYKDAKMHVLNTYFSAWSKLYRKGFLDKFDDFTFPQGAYEDVLFHVKVFLRAERISYTEKFIYLYRTNLNSITHNANGFDIFTVVNSVEQYLKEDNHIDEFAEEFKLFKVTQLLNYLLISQSNDYFSLVKSEFSKINITEKSLLNKYKSDRYNLVLECENIMEYYFKHDKLVNDELNRRISKLKNENKKLKKEIKKLKSENNETVPKKSRFNKLFSLK